MKNSVSTPAFAAAQGDLAATGKRARPRIEFARLRDLALLPALVLLLVIGGFVSPSFLTKANLISVLGASAALALVVLAESLIVLTGKFDLSLESTVGIAPAIGAMLVMPAASAGFGLQWPAFAGLIAIVAVGALIGFVNGFLVVRLRLNAFIVTLAMLIVLRGMLVGATKGGTLFDMPPSFFALATTIVLGLPLSVWLAAAAFAVAAAIGGLIVTGYVGAINANQGNGMIFTVFAAAVIGGISLDGGKGTMFGALLGVLLLGVVQNLLTLAQVPSFWVQAIYGAIILGSLMVARLAGGEAQN
jgi:simple sugar transport system permease protein